METLRDLERRSFAERTEYSLDFENAEGGGGFTFPCSEDGEVDMSELQEAAIANLNGCLSGEIPTKGPGQIVSSTYQYAIAGSGICACGRKVWLYDTDCNQCECGVEYFSNGDPMAPREQWGEETGETLSDIMGLGRGED
jgi:hypothetical protein